MTSDKNIDQPEMYFNAKPDKRSTLIPLIICGVVVAAAIIGWLIYQNNKNSDTINSLQRQVVETKQKEDQQQQINNAIAEKNLKYRTNWDKFIKERHSEPQVNYTWGGVSSFTVAVGNGTEYTLDQVDVLVEYIRKSGEVWERKTVSLFNIPANSEQTQTAPSSVNGVKVNVAIQKIICKQMQFCYPINNGNSSDPYLCN